MNKLTATWAVVIAASVLLNCTQGSKKISLQYKFEPGQKLTYKQVSKARSQAVYPDSLGPERFRTFTVSIDLVVSKVRADKTADLVEASTVEYERPSELDSTVTETVEEYREVLLTVQPNGKVVDIEFLNMEDYTSLQYIKNYYEQGMPVFPAGELTVGEGWTQNTRVILPDETMEASMTYEVTALVREAGFDCAVIECDGNLIIPVVADPADSVQRSGVDRIESTGRLYFAYKEGFVVLQRERWVIDRERKRAIRGSTEEFKEAVEIDTEFALKQRSFVDSLRI